MKKVSLGITLTSCFVRIGNVLREKPYRLDEPELQSRLKDLYRSSAIAPSRRWKHEGNNEILLVATSHQEITTSPVHLQVQPKVMFLDTF